MQALPIVLPFMGNKPIIIDGGANIGQTVRSYLSVRVQSRIHAFEPGPAAFDMLQKQGFGPQVVLNRLALSDFDGEAEFHSNEGPSEVASLLQRVDGVKCCPLTQSFKVPCARLDSYAEAARLEHIDVLKLDLQGGELRALKGAERLFREKRVDVVVCEVWYVPSYDGAPYYWEIGEFLQRSGFRTWYIDTVVYQDLNEGRWGDAVYVRADVLKSTFNLEFSC